MFALGLIEERAGFRPHPGCSTVCVHNPIANDESTSNADISVQFKGENATDEVAPVLRSQLDTEQRGVQKNRTKTRTSLRSHTCFKRRVRRTTQSRGSRGFSALVHARRGSLGHPDRIAAGFLVRPQSQQTAFLAVGQ